MRCIVTIDIDIRRDSGVNLNDFQNFCNEENKENKEKVIWTEAKAKKQDQELEAFMQGVHKGEIVGIEGATIVEGDDDQNALIHHSEKLSKIASEWSSFFKRNKKNGRKKI